MFNKILVAFNSLEIGQQVFDEALSLAMGFGSFNTARRTIKGRIRSYEYDKERTNSGSCAHEPSENGSSSSTKSLSWLHNLTPSHWSFLSF